MSFRAKQLLQAGYLDFHVSVRLQQEALSKIGTDSTSQEIHGDLVLQSQGLVTRADVQLYWVSSSLGTPWEAVCEEL